MQFPLPLTGNFFPSNAILHLYNRDGLFTAYSAESLRFVLWCFLVQSGLNLVLQWQIRFLFWGGAPRELLLVVCSSSCSQIPFTSITIVPSTSIQQVRSCRNWKQENLHTDWLRTITLLCMLKADTEHHCHQPHTHSHGRSHSYGQILTVCSSLTYIHVTFHLFVPQLQPAPKESSSFITNPI